MGLAQIDSEMREFQPQRALSAQSIEPAAAWPAGTDPSALNPASFFIISKACNSTEVMLPVRVSLFQGLWVQLGKYRIGKTGGLNSEKPA